MDGPSDTSPRPARSRLILIDGTNSLYRAFFALPPLRAHDGTPTHAALGFVNMLNKVIREEGPDHLAVVFDPREKSFRHDLYPAYKATRDRQPEDLSAQLPLVRDLVEAYGIPMLVVDGFEADDVIASLVQAAADRFEIAIVSTDKDLMQLVDGHTVLLDTMKDQRIGPAEVEARFGVPPERVLDLRALTGDSSDNIPGVRGIGEKTAARLLAEFGDLDTLLEHPERIKAKGQREKIEAGIADARLSRELSRLREDLPLELVRDEVRIPEPDRERLAELFRELEFRRLLEEIEGGAPVPVLAASAEASAVDTECVRGTAALRALAARLDGARELALSLWLEPPEPMRGELCGIGLAEDAGHAAFVPVAPGDEVETLELLRPLFASEARAWSGWDLKGCAVALARRGIELCGELRDAPLAAYVADSSQQLRPEVLVRAYLSAELPAADDVFGKGAKRRSARELEPEALAAFAGAQTAAATAVRPRIERQLEERGQLQLYGELEVPLVLVLARMERAGVRIDEAHLESLSAEICSQLDTLELCIYELAGGEFKINSPKQLQQVLFEKLELPPGKKTKTGFSTDESVLEELAGQHELPGQLLEYRRLSKLDSTYVRALPRLVHPETGRLHCQFHQTVAATGRLSASNPDLQNIPVRTPIGQRIRQAFIPAEGKRLLSADYSQIELRILAHLSGDEALVRAFQHGEDIHVRTASDVFEVPPGEVTPELRSRTKAINFGIIYGSSAFGLARQLGIAQRDAAQHIRDYFERYPGVRAFLDGAVEQARRQGYAETLSGRRRYLPDLHSRNRVLRSAAERMATNAIIQGTAADIIKRAMIQLDADLQAPGAPRARMILQVHDELLFEVAPTDAEALAERVSARMQDVPELRVAVEVHLGTGDDWLEAH